MSKTKCPKCGAIEVEFVQECETGQTVCGGAERYFNGEGPGCGYIVARGTDFSSDFVTHGRFTGELTLTEEPAPVAKVKKRAWYNKEYTIRRETLLEALGLPKRIPLGLERTWTNVVIPSGHYGDGPNMLLPVVRLVPRGVANRIQVRCPKCAKWFRFCGLQQHVGSPTCQRAADKLPMTLTEIATAAGEIHAKHQEGLPTYDMDGSFFAYNPSRAEVEIQKLAEKHGFTLQQVKDEINRLDYQAMLEAMADDGPYGRIV